MFFLLLTLAAEFERQVLVRLLSLSYCIEVIYLCMVSIEAGAGESLL